MSNKELQVQVTTQTLAEVKNEMPALPTVSRILLPRIGMVSQDITEETKNPKTGKKEIRVTSEAGTFFIEHQIDELDENGNKKWVREDVGTGFEGIIFYHRNQLRFYDEKTELYTSSPIYDSPSEVIPLFCNKSEVDRGTAVELKKKYEYTDKDGKTRSKLEDNRVLYVMYKDEAYQMNLRGSSMYAFERYARTVILPSVITAFSSEPREKGTIAWNQMTFKVKEQLPENDVREILKNIRDMKAFITAEKMSFGTKTAVDKELEELSGNK